MIVQHLAAALLACGIWVKIANFIAKQGMHADARFQMEVPHLVAVGLLLYTVSVALHYMYLAQQDSREAEMLARDAELRALKAQINPHFLFNSLNSITALTTVDPARAREMCIRLSDFLRNTLGLGERETHFLARRAGAFANISRRRAGAFRLAPACGDRCGRGLRRIAWCLLWCSSR